MVCIFYLHKNTLERGKKLFFFHLGFIRTTRDFVSPIKAHPGPFVMSEKLLIPLLNCAIWKILTRAISFIRLTNMLVEPALETSKIHSTTAALFQRPGCITETNSQDTL